MRKEKDLKILVCSGNLGGADKVVLDAHQLVDHGLVGPLVEQWGDRIIPPVQNQEKGRGVWLLELKQLVLLLHHILQTHITRRERRGGEKEKKERKEEKEERKRK